MTTADLQIACEQCEQAHSIGALLDAIEEIVAPRLALLGVAIDVSKADDDVPDVSMNVQR